MATEVVIPMLGVTIETGIIVEWLKNEGDPVEKGESIFVVEADKVARLFSPEVISTAEHFLHNVLIPDLGSDELYVVFIKVALKPDVTHHSGHYGISF